MRLKLRRDSCRSDGAGASTKEDAEEETAETQAEPNQASQVSKEIEIKKEPDEASSLQANGGKPAENSDSAQAGPTVKEAVTSAGAQATDAEMSGADAEVEAAGSADGKGDGEAGGENERSEAVEGGKKEIEVIEGEEEEQNLGGTSLQPGDDAVPDATKVKGLRSAIQSSPQPKGPPQLSLNRIFLSFAANRKRLAIDAEAVKWVKIHRSEHWVEICIDVTRQSDQAMRKKGEEYLVCNGTLLEKRTKGQENYTAVTKSDIAAAWDAAQADTKPARARCLRRSTSSCHPSSVCRLVYRDGPARATRPIRTAARTSLAPQERPQRASRHPSAGQHRHRGKSDTAVSVATAQHVWTGKIEVLDPDPPPSMSRFLYDWVKESFIGSQKERRKFIYELLGREKKPTIKAEEDFPTASSEESDNARDARIARSFVEIVCVSSKASASPLPRLVRDARLDLVHHLDDLPGSVDARPARPVARRRRCTGEGGSRSNAHGVPTSDAVEGGRSDVEGRRRVGEEGRRCSRRAVKAAGVAKSGVQGRRHQQAGRQQHHGGAGARHGKRKRG